MSAAASGSAQPPPKLGTRTGGDELMRIVRLLIAMASRLALAKGNFRGDVLLDVEVQGVRCLLLERHTEAETDPHTHVGLSPREHEIARLVAEGYPNKTIAAVLDISSWTVSTHLRRIFAKLGVRTRAAMVARLVEEGLTVGHEGHGAALD